MYLGLCGLLYVVQRRMIYIPSPSRNELPPGFVEWTAPDGHLLGYKRVAKSTNCLYFLHGNAGNARSWAAATEAFPGDVFVLEYPGYGEREGAPSEASLKRAALEGFDHLPVAGKITVCGESLGTGIAEVLMRQRTERMGLLVLITPFTSLLDMARAQMPFVPTGLLLKDRLLLYDAWLAYPGRSWVVLADHDEVIPKSQSKKYADRAGANRKVMVMPMTSHNTISLSKADWGRLLAY
jgi:hypothetical protein